PRLGKTDGDGLFSVLHSPALTGFAGTQRAALSAPHCSLYRFARGLSVSRHCSSYAKIEESENYRRPCLMPPRLCCLSRYVRSLKTPYGVACAFPVAAWRLAGQGTNPGSRRANIVLASLGPGKQPH